VKISGGSFATHVANLKMAEREITDVSLVSLAHCFDQQVGRLFRFLLLTIFAHVAFRTIDKYFLDSGYHICFVAVVCSIVLQQKNIIKPF
jgi:hypothetical protein